MTLKLLTYNVYFDQLHQQQRFLEIIKIILTQKPDVVALQEITPNTFQMLLCHEPLLKEYHLSTDQFVWPYNVVTLSRHPIIDSRRFPFPKSQMGRHIEMIQIMFQEKPITIANLHLESIFLHYRDFRQSPESQQLKIQTKIDQFNYVFQKLPQITPDKPIFIMGDTNITPQDSDYFVVPKSQANQGKWVDAVTTFQLPEKYLLTYDYSKNSLIRGKFKSRSDRIYYRNPQNSGSDSFVPITFTIIGAEPIPGIKVCPSDHFGLLLEFEDAI